MPQPKHLQQTTKTDAAIYKLTAAKPAHRQSIQQPQPLKSADTASLARQTLLGVPMPFIKQTCRRIQPTQPPSPRQHLYGLH